MQHKHNTEIICYKYPSDIVDDKNKNSSKFKCFLMGYDVYLLLCINFLWRCGYAHCLRIFRHLRRECQRKRWGEV